MSSWIEYERKRAALERKWRPRIFKALQSQVSSFIEEGYPNVDTINYSSLIGVLKALYSDVGARVAKDTRRELAGQGKAFNMVMRTKFRGIGGGEEFAQDISRRLASVGLNLAQKMSETTRERIRMIIAYGVEQGWSVQEIVKEIRARVTEINRNRALTITRTEVGRSANEGKLISAMALGVMVDKIWLTAKDERVRRRPRDKADHLIMHDKQIEVDKRFDNGMLIPGDYTAKPQEVINCRCTVVFKVVRDADGKTIPKNYLMPARNAALDFVGGLAAGITIGTLLD
jgi:hypothetical protein